jgi:hypothetical protein
MNLKPRTFLNQLTKLTACGLLAAGTMTVMRAVGAQSVLMSPPALDTAPASVQDDQVNSEMSVFLPSGLVRDESLAQPLKFGPVTFRPHPYYRFLYGSGIQSSTNSRQNTVIQEIAPGITVDVGRHWTLDYTPTIRLYSSSAFRDSLDHSASLTGGTRYEDWIFGLSQTFAMSDSTLTETATQTKQEQYVTSLTASRMLNDKMFADFGVFQKFNFVSGSQNSRDWSTFEWLNYQFFKRLSAGVGVGGGYTMLDVGADQAYEQLQARVKWRATDKLALSVNAGFEERQILASGFGDSLNPIFGANVEYQPFDHTQITLAASRTVSSSDYFVASQSQETTSVSVSVNQRLLKKFFLSVGAGYTRADFTVTSASQRADDNYYFNARLSRAFLKRGTVAVTYQYGDNQSSQAGYSYRSNQVGFEVGFSY